MDPSSGSVHHVVPRARCPLPKTYMVTGFHFPDLGLVLLKTY